MATEAEWAWAAGFYEGEGSITLAGSKSKCLSLRIGQKDPESLLRWNYIVQCGRIYGPYKNNGGHGYFYWQANKYADVDRVVKELLPWLTQRRKEQVADVYYRYGQYQAGLQKNRIESTMEDIDE